MNHRQTLMALAELAADPSQLVPSPCTSVCRIDPRDGLCLGCLRDIDEIVGWGRMDEDARRVIWQSIRARAQAQRA